MSVSVEVINTDNKNAVSAHCSDCWTVLEKNDLGSEPVTEEAVDLMMSVAYRHVQKHPKHNPIVYIYQKQSIIPEPGE